jgi:adenosine kinase
MIRGAEVLIANDYELEMIRKKTGLDKGKLIERTRAIIATLGDKGSVVFKGGKEVHVPAVRAANVVDPTGAGDAYRAGLVKGLARGRRLEDAARMGATCASFAVERHGTQEHRFTETEFWERHRAHFGGGAE